MTVSVLYEYEDRVSGQVKCTSMSFPVEGDSIASNFEAAKRKVREAGKSSGDKVVRISGVDIGERYPLMVPANVTVG